MTPQHSAHRSGPLGQIAEHLARLSRTEEGTRVFERFACSGLDVGDSHDLGDLLGHCAGPDSESQLSETIRALVPLAPCDEVAALCVLVILRPALDRMVRLLARRAKDAEDAEAEVVAVAFEVIARKRLRNGQPLDIGPLVDAIWTGARRSAGLRRHGLPQITLPEDFDQPSPEVDPLERCPGLLAAAIARGVLSAHSAVVIAQSRMEGRPLDEIALALGRPYNAVRLERWRAEAALRDFARVHYSGEGE
jgi:DNA-directed RNA polymerase specialized sigma24 family protein